MRFSTKVSDRTDPHLGTGSLFGEALGICQDIRKLRWKMKIPVHLTDMQIEANECKKVVSEGDGSTG